MPKTLLLLVPCLVLLLSLSAMAGKDYEAGLASSELCTDCVYDIEDVEVRYDLWSHQLTLSSHDFCIDSDGKTVTTLEATFEILHSHENLLIEFHGKNATWDDWTVEAVHPNDTTSWYHFEWDGLNEILDGSPVGSLQVWGYNPYTCREPGDPLTINIADSSEISYVNLFQDDQEPNAEIWIIPGEGDPPPRNHGSMKLRDPSITLTVLEPLQSTGDVVAETWVGGTADVDLFLQNINFEFEDGYECTLAFDEELDFEYVIATDWAYDWSCTLSITGETDTTVTFSTTSLREDYMWAIADPLSLDFMTVGLNVEATAEQNTNYKVRIKGDAIFTGCDLYADTSNIDATYGYVHTVEEEACWKLDDVNVVKGTQDYHYFFYMNNTAPVWTDNEDNASNALYTFDNTTQTKTTYDGVSSSYDYTGQGDYYHWGQYVDDSVSIFEAPSQESDEKSPSASFEKVGYLKIDCGSVTGTDEYNFVVIEDDQHPDYQDDNWVVIKHTENTLYRVDDVVGGQPVYGNLCLVDGEITLVNPPPPPPCPTLYTWDGSGWVIENPILTHSQGKKEPQPAADYYPMKFGVIERNGLFQVELREDAEQITFLDQVELIVVDYPRESKVSISHEGEVVSYREGLAPIAAVDDHGRDVLPLVISEDNNWYSSDGPGSLTLTYPNTSFGRETFRFALGDGGGPGDKEKIPKQSIPYGEEDLIAEVQDVNGDWHYLGSVQPRQFESANSGWVCDLDDVQLDRTFQVRVTWRTGFKVDCQALHVDDGSSFVEHRLQPLDVDHSALGKVVSSVVDVDTDVLTLVPGQRILFSFDAPERPDPANNARRFFFKSHGYYRDYLKSDQVPSDFALDDNYPNPFNPTTTIGFSVPHACHVTLRVYNVLGQEVTTLYDGDLSAGQHQIVWEGLNSSGEQVSSGVYFYRLKAGDFTSSKKMTLIK